MTEGEVMAKLGAGGVKLALDTNTLWSKSKLEAISEGVKRWNERLRASERGPVRMLVSTVAHAEKLRQLKQRLKGTFDEGVILAGLESLGLEIEPFSAHHAMRTATRLGERYQDDGAWREAKRKRCLECLGLSREMETPGKGSGCGATNDWLIGGHALAEGCVLVTGDTGVEFAGLVERVKPDVLIAALGALNGGAP